MIVHFSHCKKSLGIEKRFFLIAEILIGLSGNILIAVQAGLMPHTLIKDVYFAHNCSCLNSYLFGLRFYLFDFGYRFLLVRR